MAWSSGFSSGSSSSPSGHLSARVPDTEPSGSRPAGSPCNCRAAGLKTVILPSASQATMPSSSVSSRTWRNCSLRCRSPAARRTAVMSISDTTAPAIAPSGDRTACALRRTHMIGRPCRRTPSTNPTNRRPNRRHGSSGSSPGTASSPSSSKTSTPRSGADVSTSAIGRPRTRMRGASNMTSKDSFTRRIVPSTSTSTTPSASESMTTEWISSTSWIRRSSCLRSVTSRRLTTMPPIGSSRWFTAISSRSIGTPSALTVCISREIVNRRRATRSSKSARTGSTLKESSSPNASVPIAPSTW